MDHATAPARRPLPPPQRNEEPDPPAAEDDIPAPDHEPDGTQPSAQAHDGDEVGRHADA